MSHEMLVIIQFATPVIITGTFGWLQAKKSSGTDRESIYADHIPELWERIDKVNSALDSVTKERNEFKDQVDSLKEEISKLNDSIAKLEKKLKEKDKETNNE